MVAHGITSLTAQLADPAALAGLARGHWSIENGVHRVRDTTDHEDASQVRTGNAPAVMAALRNIVTNALRLAGAVNSTTARRAATLNLHSIIRLSTHDPSRRNRRCGGALRQGLL